MNLLSWNCWGLGNHRTVQELYDLCRNKSPYLVFLCETKCNQHAIERIKTKLNLFGFSVPARGRSGGLAMLWKKDIDVSLRAFIDRFIDVNLTFFGLSLRITGVYGELDVSLRRSAWCQFSSLNSDPSTPWLCLGDFNEILVHNEFKGNGFRADWQIWAFRETLDSCGLSDMGYVGNWYTWQRLLNHPYTQRARLDRCVYNQSWRNTFGFNNIAHVSTIFSDHSLLSIQINTHNPIHSSWSRRKPFRFEAYWVKASDCEKIVQDCWTTSLDSLPDKLNNCALGLLSWGSKYKRDFRVKIENLKKELSSLRNGLITPDTKIQIHDTEIQLEFLFEQENIYWKQRSKQHWYRDGDRNTSFFHAHVSRR